MGRLHSCREEIPHLYKPMLHVHQTMVLGGQVAKHWTACGPGSSPRVPLLQGALSPTPRVSLLQGALSPTPRVPLLQGALSPTPRVPLLQGALSPTPQGPSPSGCTQPHPQVLRCTFMLFRGDIKTLKPLIQGTCFNSCLLQALRIHACAACTSAACTSAVLCNLPVSRSGFLTTCTSYLTFEPKTFFFA